MSNLKMSVLSVGLNNMAHASFTQLNPTINPFQRSFVGEIRRIDEMARHVRFFSNQIEKEKDVIPIRPLYDSAPLITVGPRAAQTIDDLDVTLAEHESRLTKMNDSYQTLSDRTKELVEARHVLRETAVFFDKVSWDTQLCSLLNLTFCEGSSSTEWNPVLI
jgi:V-type H+-transporting ATPase subunit a